MSAKGLIIAAPRSGSGKTSVTIGLMRAFRRQGLAVAGAKSGPDYIDPGFHAAATGRAGVNLDSWAMPPDLLDRLATGQCEGADLVLIESAMGLFDGLNAQAGRRGAAADLARRYALPVLLVLDVSGQSQSAAAVAHGFATFEPEVSIAGVVLNQVASERHEHQCRDALEARGIRVFGAVRRNAEMRLPERHLGLVQAREHPALEGFIEALAEKMEASLDLEAIKEAAQPFEAGKGGTAHLIPPPGQRIALAEDEAFSFVYPHLLRHWRSKGAEIRPFSPLANEAPDAACDLCWLPGGYPELHAGKLATARRFMDGLRDFARSRPVHGECGGFMVLGQGLVDGDGARHEMAGLLGHVTSYAKRRIHLGYREARLRAHCPIGGAGVAVRGHEFHYASTVDTGADEPLADLFDGTGRPLGPAGGRRGRVTGTFFHAIAKGEA